MVWIKLANSLYAAGEAGTVSLFSIPKQCLVETIKHTQDPVYSMAQNKDVLDSAWTRHANPVTRMEIAGN